MKTRWFALFASVVCFALAMAGSVTVRASQARDPVLESPPADALGEMPLDQIIIKYKDSADVTGLNAPDGLNRMKTLSVAAGVELQYFRPMSGDAHVLRLPGKLPVAEVERIAQKLAALPDVEYADPDYIRRITLVPNDTQYSSQWHYFEQYGINAPAAWDITTGSSSTVVAVIDTGYRPHADLAGRFVSGYDFIADPFIANDGGGRDNDASDPGDWIAADECGFPHPAEDSSWHGTHVAGTIGANSNNGVGVAGINWNAWILPIRVLGKCGGTDSDIIDGMKWAAGLSVPGVSNNLNPAKVLNLSLGGSGACTSSWQTAINSITGAGVAVIVAAGNSNTNASGFTPANCSGVITVAATDRGGDRASYSNFGSVVEISGPGGETGTNSPSPAPANGVLSTLNQGTTVPAADSYVYYQGTSMATPHVVGVASLLYALNPSLTPAQVGRILTSTVTAFPGGSSCSTSTCGAGIVNAGAAVAVLPRITSTSPISAATGGPTFTLTISGANFVNGAVVQWNGSDRATRFVNSTQLTATIAAADIALSGARNVTVRLTHPTYGSLTTAAKTFNVSGSTDTFVYLPLVMKNWPPIVSHTYTPSTDDTNLRTVDANTWYGNFIDYAVGYSTASGWNFGVARAIMRFDLSSIPSGASISSATLQPYLRGYIYATGKPSSMAVTAYRINQAWPASPTWNNFAGAFAESYGSATVGTSIVRYTIDVKALVQGWVNGTWPNYGLMLRGQEGGYINAKLFYSANASSTVRPWLVVDYPDSTSGAMVTAVIPAEPVEIPEGPSVVGQPSQAPGKDVIFAYIGK